MRPSDEIPFEQGDYSDVALMLASVREWPAEEFARELDARVQRRFGRQGGAAAAAGRRPRRPGRMLRWVLGPASAAVAAGVAAVIVLSAQGPASPSRNGALTGHGSSQPPRLVLHAQPNRAAAGSKPRFQGLGAPVVTPAVHAPSKSAGASLPPNSGASSLGASGTSSFNTAGVNATSAAPVIPGAKQIQSAQISLATPNQHVDQVALEVIGVVSLEHGTVQSSQITSGTSSSGGGYASFLLSFPTTNLQDALNRLSRLQFAALSSRTDGSQNVSGAYNADERQLTNAKDLRLALLKQLAAATTQQQIDSIDAQLKLATAQIAHWQAVLAALQHRISYSNVSVQINAGGLPILPVVHNSSFFTLGRASHDALRVLVVSAGVALIALAVALPVALLVALLMWLWVWRRQRRREHALDSAA